MCLVVVAYRAHQRFPLVVAANRDEFHARPTEPASFWKDANILGGRDLQSGGTWLGVTGEGRFAAVTNYHEPREKRPDDLSRGKLVTDFLTQNISPEGFLAGIDPARYAGFGLFLSDLASFAYFSNRAGSPRLLGPGIYGLSNHLLDTDWLKVRRAKNSMSALLSSETISEQALFDLLGQRSVSRNDAAFVVDPVHGTRSSTVVIVESNGEVRFVERGFDAAGNAVYARPFGFRGVSMATAITPAV